MEQKVNRITQYILIWWRFTVGATQIAFASRLGASIFIVGKLLRFVFLFLFIFLLFSRTSSIAGYSLSQMIFFFLTFNIIDTIPQFLWRDVYRFRGQIVNGYFDYTLLKPISPLFKSLFGGSDMFDFFILVMLSIFLYFSFHSIGVVAAQSVVIYLLLVVNACMISLAFHIFVLCLGVLTTEVDNAIMLYRDITQMGRFPIDIYKEPLRGFLTFVVPVGIMMTFPAKAVTGLFSLQLVCLSFVIGITLLAVSILCWRYALRHYASASS